MAVAFDAVGPAGGAGTSATSGTTLTWAHICGGSATLLLVGVGVPPTSTSVINSVTYNSVAMTLVLRKETGSGTDGAVAVYALANPTTGSNNVVVTQSVAYTVSHPIEGGSISYTGANGYQNVASAAGTSTTASVAVTSSSGNMAAAFMAASQAWTAVNQTLRYRMNLNNNNAAGNVQGEDAAGAASVTLTGTHTSDWWGIVGLDIIAAGAAAGDRILVQPPRRH